MTWWPFPLPQTAPFTIAALCVCVLTKLFVCTDYRGWISSAWSNFRDQLTNASPNPCAPPISSCKLGRTPDAQETRKLQCVNHNVFFYYKISADFFVSLSCFVCLCYAYDYENQYGNPNVQILYSKFQGENEYEYIKYENLNRHHLWFSLSKRSHSLGHSWARIFHSYLVIWNKAFQCYLP